MRMERAGYYLAVLGVVSLAGVVPARSQSANPLPAADCESLAASAAPAQPDSAALTKRLLDCGYELNTKSEYRQAQIVFERAGEMASRRSDQKALASAMAGSGMVWRALGQVDRAEPLLRQSLQISEAIDDKDGMAFALSQLGRVRNAQARYEEARDYHARSFELSNEIGDRQGAAVALNNVGAMYRAVGDYVTALEYYQRSLDLLDQLGDRRRSATVLDNMGSVARQLGDYAQGLSLTMRALEIREAFNDRLGIANGLDSQAVFYQAEGNYVAALAALQKSLAIRQALGASHGTAEALTNIAGVYQAQGDYRQAVSYLRKALALNEKVGSRSLLAAIETQLGELLMRQGQPAEALRALRRSLAISEPAGYKIQEADALFVLGRLHLEQGRLTAAADALTRCLELRTSSRALAGEAETLIELAEIERRRRNHSEGLKLTDRAEQLTARMELPELAWRALTVGGRLKLATNRRDDARKAFDAAIAVIEDLRTQVAGGGETRSRFFADRIAPYRERIALALTESRIADAFHFAERSKAQALLEIMRSDRVPIATMMDADERRRENALRRALRSLNSEVLFAAQASLADEPRLRTARRKQEAKRLEYEDFLATLYATHPELRVARAAVPAIPAGEAAALLSSDAAAIVEFVVGLRESWAFVIDSASGPKAVALPVTSAELDTEVDRFRRQLAARDLRAQDTARRLHDRVLGPVRAALAGKTDLTIVPDGTLWGLPFQALRSSTGRYLIEDFAISYAPSVTVLREMMRTAPTRTSPSLLAFGNPTLGAEAEPLPDTEAQVNQLARLYGESSRIYVRTDASESRLKSEAARHDIIHVASHGVVDDRSPLYSYVALASSGPGGREDGLVEAWEIMSLPLKARLVVLSACETARGQVSAGEGVIGLMWALFVAGSPATLVSQWKVESASSTALMVGFHEAWNGGRSRISKARALQLASLELLRARATAHPFHWAGYILAGDPR